jgi:Ni/Co efflux regulator RcnB
MNKTLLAVATALIFAGSADTAFARHHHHRHHHRIRHAAHVVAADTRHAAHVVKEEVKEGVNRVTTDDNDEGMRWDETHYRMTQPHVYTTVTPYTGPAYVAPTGYHYTRYVYGSTLPAGYYGDTYYITDYQTYNLPPPPDGYRWNRVGNDVYLVETTDGKIRDAVYDLFH